MIMTYTYLTKKTKLKDNMLINMVIQLISLKNDKFENYFSNCLIKVLQEWRFDFEHSSAEYNSIEVQLRWVILDAFMWFSYILIRSQTEPKPLFLKNF